jgi:hypothetical protein
MDLACFSFLKEMTGTEMKYLNDFGFDIKQSLRQKFIHYQLTKMNSQEMSYRPTAASVSLDELPDSLADEISFKLVDLPLFMYQISKWLASVSV